MPVCNSLAQITDVTFYAECLLACTTTQKWGMETRTHTTVLRLSLRRRLLRIQRQSLPGTKAQSSPQTTISLPNKQTALGDGDDDRGVGSL